MIHHPIERKYICRPIRFNPMLIGFLNIVTFFKLKLTLGSSIILWFFSFPKLLPNNVAQWVGALTKHMYRSHEFEHCCCFYNVYLSTNFKNNLWSKTCIVNIENYNRLKSILIIMNYNPKASNITLMEVKKMKKWRVFGYSNLYRKKYLHVYAIFSIILKMRSNSVL